MIEDGVPYGEASLGSLLRLAGGCAMLQSHAFPRYMGPMPPLWLSPSLYIYTVKNFSLF